MKQLNEYTLRYARGCMFYDSETGFQLNLAGFFPFEPGLAENYANLWDKVLQNIRKTEEGQKVNKTGHPTESENRPVDHYNLRLNRRQSTIEGKSLEDSLELFERLKDELQNHLAATGYEHIVFNGIGGSYLGPFMILLFSRGADYNSGPKPTCHFLSNADPASFKRLTEHLDPAKTCFVHISKSGSTAETAANLESAEAWLAANGLETGRHSFAITTPSSGLDKHAAESGYAAVWPMNESTGGRTSIISAVGMAVCAAAGLDFAEFARGMSYMDSMTRRHELLENPAGMIAVAVDRLRLSSGNQNMIMLGYSDALREFAHYCQQLYMESLGKNYSVENQPLRTGLSTFGGVGTSEQHAFMQQIQKGLRDSFVRFYSFRERDFDLPSAKYGSMGTLLQAFIQGTQRALLQNNVNFISQVHRRCDLFNLGMMVALEERIVSILASFWGINAYDQPGVQDGKKAATAFLKLHSSVRSFLIEKKIKEGSAPGLVKAMKLADDQEVLVEDILEDLAANDALYARVNNLKALPCRFSRDVNGRVTFSY